MQSIIHGMWPQVRNKLIERIGEKAMEIAEGEDTAETNWLLSPYVLNIRDPDALWKELYQNMYKASADGALAKEAQADQTEAAKTKTELDKKQSLKTKNQIDKVNRIIIAAGPDANPDDVVTQITTAIPKLKDFKPTRGSLKIYVSTLTNQFYPIALVPQPQIAGDMVLWQKHQAEQLAGLGVELYWFLAY